MTTIIIQSLTTTKYYSYSSLNEITWLLIIFTMLLSKKSNKIKIK